MSDSKVIRSKKCQNLSLGLTFLAAQLFFLSIFIEAATTDIDILLHV